MLVYDQNMMDLQLVLGRAPQVLLLSEHTLLLLNRTRLVLRGAPEILLLAKHTFLFADLTRFVRWRAPEVLLLAEHALLVIGCITSEALLRG